MSVNIDVGSDCLYAFVVAVSHALTSWPEEAAASSAFRDSDNAGPAASPTAAYCPRTSSTAFTDQGMISQSRHTQSVSSSSHVPVTSKALRNRPSTASSNVASSKKLRPVRV